MEDFWINRNLEVARSCIKRLELDLDGLCVLTECASKAYAYTPLLAALSGAKVMSVGRDTSYGQFYDNKSYIERLFEISNANVTIEFYENELPESKWAEADIITNSGMLRPFTSEKISRLHSESVIALMWETWELRDGEIDISACQKRGVPVVGTNENFEQSDMYSYPGMMCLKMLFEMGLEVANNSFILVGEGLPGSLIARDFRRLGIDFDWFVDSTAKYEREGPCWHYSEIGRILERDRIDAIICADHACSKPVIGSSGYLGFTDLHKAFPYAQWAHLTGPVDVDELGDSGINYYPKDIQPTGYLTYSTERLGWEPVITLNAAGLKVGELVAKARSSGLSLADSIKASVDYGIGQDFEGGFMNYGNV